MITSILRRRSAPRQLVARLLEDPGVVERVRALSPRVLGALVERVGLEDAGDLIALASPAQLRGVLDVDLWRGEHPGEDERFEPARFARWLEVMLEAGADAVADRLLELPEELVTLGLHGLVLVIPLDELAARLEDDEAAEQALESVLTSEQTLEAGTAADARSGAPARASSRPPRRPPSCASPGGRRSRSSSARRGIRSRACTSASSGARPRTSCRPISPPRSTTSSSRPARRGSRRRRHASSSSSARCASATRRRTRRVPGGPRPALPGGGWRAKRAPADRGARVPHQGAGRRRRPGSSPAGGGGACARDLRRRPRAHRRRPRGTARRSPLPRGLAPRRPVMASSPP